MVDHRGQPREVTEYALHVQCPWRVLQGDQYVVGSSDMFRPRPGWTGEGDFDWDVQGANRFDVRVARLNELLADGRVAVTSVDVTAWADLTISLSYGFRIEVLRLTSSVRTELWRFFRLHRDEPHVVVFTPPD
ncbi:hypothetical protein [Lentzea sp. NPDC004782]|uniref:hypothetical protein n=1 Tax=Lentzea sp. NPDC004782 TaxID=3154458 RepID=UPI0033B6F06B